MLTDDQNDPRAIPTKENIVSISMGFIRQLMLVIANLLYILAPLYAPTLLCTCSPCIDRVVYLCGYSIARCSGS